MILDLVKLTINMNLHNWLVGSMCINSTGTLGFILAFSFMNNVLIGICCNFFVSQFPGT